MKTIENALLELKNRGLKITKYRTALLESFFTTDHPFSVQEILDILQERGLEPNKTTVYRELDVLIEQGIVKELDLGDNRKRYEFAHLDHHHHLICTQCNSISDVVLDEDFVNIEKKVQKTNNFTITDHLLEFYGLCSRCH